MTKHSRATPVKLRERPTIALLADYVEEGYQESIWHGVVDQARAQDVNLLCFVGGELLDPEQRLARIHANELYELAYLAAQDGLLDGIVVMAGSVGSLTGGEAMADFCARFHPLPIVSIGMALPGIPSVMVDNYRGIHDGVSHLIEVHGLHHIAFIRQIQGHPEGDERYRAYADALAEHGIALDPNLVAVTHYSNYSKIVHLLLDERQVDFEALVGDDYSVTNTASLLQTRGIRIPHDIALVGFDDAWEASNFNPPLTTARQPLREMGQQAIDIALSQIAGEKAPELTVLPTKLILRRSCGCMNPEVVRVTAGLASPAQPAKSGLDLAARRDTLLQAMVQAADVDPAETVAATSIVSDELLEGQIRLGKVLRQEVVHLSSSVSEWAKQILDAFTAELDKSPGVFLVTLEELLSQATVWGRGASIIDRMVSALRYQVLPDLDAKTLPQAENLWHQARVLTGEAKGQMQLNQRTQGNRLSRTLRTVSRNMATALNMKTLMDMIPDFSQQLGILDGYVALYEKDDQAASVPTPWSRLYAAYNRGESVEMGTGSRRFLTRQLIPSGLWPSKRYSLTIMPIYFLSVPVKTLGYAILDTGARIGEIYHAFTQDLGNAVMGAFLVQQVEDRRAELQGTLAMLEQRNSQLQTASEVSQATSNILEPDTLMHEVVNLARARFDLYYAGLFLVDQGGEWTGEPGRWVVLRAGTGDAGQKMLAQNHKLEIGGASMIGWCIANRQPRIALDVGEEAVRFNNPLLPNTRSEMALPLISRGQAIGALTIQSTREAAFSDEDIAILETMAGQVANAIENARLFERTQTTLEEMEAIQRRYLQQAWAEVARIKRTSGYEQIGPELRPLGKETLPEVRQAMINQQPVIEEGDGTKSSTLTIPIMLRGQPIGALGFKAEGQREWTQDDIALAEALGEQLALAAENLRLLDESQRRAAREQLTLEITDKMRRAATVEGIVQTAVNELFDVLGTSRAFVRLGTTRSEEGNGSGDDGK